MAYRPRILPSAQAELDSIISYLLSFGPNTAKAITLEYRKQLELLSLGVVDYGLAKHPELAALGYHACLVNSYIMLYYYEGGFVVIAHLFHQSQDYAKLVIEGL